MRRNADRGLGDVLDELRSDWRPGTGPTDEQADAMQQARSHIAMAKAKLDQAAP
jgi:hypothetical protein